MQDNQQTGRSSSLDKTLNMIFEYIKKNNLKYGDRLPSERDFAEMFHIGRQAVREATHVLQYLNVIEIKKQGGMFICGEEKFNSLDYFNIYIQIGQLPLTDIYEARRILEVECISLAAQNMSDDKINEISDIVQRASVDDPKEFAEADRILHQAICEATNNKALQILMRTVHSWSGVSRNYSTTFREARELSHMDHNNIINALKKHDVEAAKKSMDVHIQHLAKINYIGEKLVKDVLGEMWPADEA
ncbi:MAG: FCD domain-containing protein [Eubacteriales bacterium]|nr:FCD domain-containing protein [Eubacteriales bacterium]